MKDDTFILRKIIVEEKNIHTNTSCKMAILSGAKFDSFIKIFTNLV
jgi:hypothetical protein